MHVFALFRLSKNKCGKIYSIEKKTFFGTAKKMMELEVKIL